jgi:cyclopropane fatty-acyl-phospholipid synthase-like methyltransferase
MRSTSAIPARIAWAVDQLAVGEADRILEIGGGRGVAAAVICARLTRGSYLGIDPSETAVRASAVRNREQLERGTARFEQQGLQDVDPTRLPRFDKVFAINVNLFWTRSAQQELALIRQLLKDQGQLYLFYDKPTPAGTSRIADLLGEHLGRAGYASTSVIATLEQSTVIGLRCLPR